MANSQATEIVGLLNELAGTTGLEADGAANAYAGTTGKSLLAALNAKAGTTNLGFNAACNAIATSAGMEGQGALKSLLPDSVTPFTGPPVLTVFAEEASVDLTWTAPAGTQNFWVFRGTSSGQLQVITHVNGGTTNYQDTDLTDNVTYYYRVQANKASFSLSSAEQSATPSLTAENKVTEADEERVTEAAEQRIIE